MEAQAQQRTTWLSQMATHNPLRWMEGRELDAQMEKAALFCAIE